MKNPHAAKKIADIFEDIPPYYDRMNTIMSLGLHHRWKRCAVNILYPLPDHAAYVDLACGTGDIAHRMLTRRRSHNPWILIDPSFGMLTAAMRRFHNTSIHTLCATAEHLPLYDKSIHTLTMGFGLRNTTDRMQSLSEIYRVLECGGQCMIMEFHQPQGVIGTAFDCYQKLLPYIGRMTAGDAASYDYLAASIHAMPSVDTVTSWMTHAGFKNITTHDMFYGMVIVYHATKDML